MKDDLDLGRFGDIGDPFGETEGASNPPLQAPTLAALAEPSPSRSRVHALRALAIGAALAFQIGWIAFCRLRRVRPEVVADPAGLIVLKLGIPLVAATMALAAATKRGERGLGLAAARIAALALGAPALFAIATTITAPADADDGLFWAHAVRCMVATLLLAAVPFALGLWSFRRAFVASASWRTAALGVASGALAAATLSMSCPVGTMGHVLVSHGAILLVAGLLGAAIARTRVVRG